MPQYRVRNTLNWKQGRHTLNLSSFTTFDYEDEGPQSAFLGAYLSYWETIDSMTIVNAQYRVNLQELLDSELTLGVKNLLNEDPPWVNVDGAYDYYTHDPRGRVCYVRYLITLL